MSIFFVLPYEPSENPEAWKNLSKRSNLIIDPAEYAERLRLEWPMSRIFDEETNRPIEWNTSHLLEWELNGLEEQEQRYLGYGWLKSDKQIVSLTTPYKYFFIWHRSVVPEEYPLWLIGDYSWKSLELKMDTTEDDIHRFWSTQGGK